MTLEEMKQAIEAAWGYEGGSLVSDEFWREFIKARLAWELGWRPDDPTIESWLK